MDYARFVGWRGFDEDVGVVAGLGHVGIWDGYLFFDFIDVVGHFWI